MTAADAPGPVVDLSHEASTGLFEIALIAVVVALATAYLWRTYFRRRRKGKGGCAGCASAGDGPCPLQPDPGGGPAPKRACDTDSG